MATASTRQGGVESTGSGRSARSSPGRARARRIIASLIFLAATLAIGRRLAPVIGREVRLGLAERAIAEGRLEDAEVRLDLLISEDLRRTRPRLLLVQVFRKQGRITEAEEALQRAIELGLPVDRARREHALLRAGDTGR